MINNVVLIGRLTRDVELRYTPSNQAVATLFRNTFFRRRYGFDLSKIRQWNQSRIDL